MPALALVLRPVDGDEPLLTGWGFDLIGEEVDESAAEVV